MSRKGFRVVFYDTLEDFYLAEALEYITAWTQSTPDNPVGICGPIGPTEQLPLVARLVNELGLDLKKKDAHFWGMDEWVIGNKEVGPDHPLSFRKADMELCFDRIDKKLRMPDKNLHFPAADTRPIHPKLGRGSLRGHAGRPGRNQALGLQRSRPARRGYKDNPPSPAEFRKLTTRMVDLHPITLMQNARTSGGGMVTGVPTRAMTVGPVETWKADKVSIWQAGCHDNAFGMRLTTLMIGKKIADSAVPMSLLADHPNVQFNFYRRGVGSCAVEMH